MKLFHWSSDINGLIGMISDCAFTRFFDVLLLCTAGFGDAEGDRINAHQMGTFLAFSLNFLLYTIIL